MEIMPKTTIYGNGTNEESNNHNASQVPKKRKISTKSGLGSNHHGPSARWNHFKKILEEETGSYTGIAECLYCSLHINAPTTIGTNPLRHHMEKCKKFPRDENDDSKQLVISFPENKLANWKFDQERCRKSLTRMIILDELPFSHVEGQGFKIFCEDMQPRFHVVCRTTVAKDCLKMFHEEKLKLKEFFKVMHPQVCITTDLWTSIQKLGYMVITAHFVDNDWNLRKKIINFQVIPHPHKGDHLAKTIEGCLIEWGIDKITTITLDNASNNDVCVKDLKKRLGPVKRNMLLLDGECFHIRCFAHVMNLVVREGVDHVKETIKRLRRSVKYVRSGSLRMQMFKECVEYEKLTSKKILCIDVKTRWNSTYLMISAALEFEKAFDRLDEQDPNYRIECAKKGVGKLDEDDWQKLKSLATFLEEFFNITKRVSASTYVTANSYFDEVTLVKNILMHHLGSDDEYFHDMSMKMNKKFEKYCNIDDLNPILVVAMILDPRYKIDYVTIWYNDFLKYSFLPESEKSAKVLKFTKKLKDVMSKLYEHYKAGGAHFLNIELSSSNNLSSDSSSSTGGVPKFHSKKNEIRVQLKRKESIDGLNDLEKYLIDCVEEDDGLDVMAWWKSKLSTYNSLAIMARDVLSIPVTSVASECAFSTAGRVLDPFRSSLTPTTVEALICTQDWLRRPISPISVEEKLEVLEHCEKVVTEEMAVLSFGSN